MFLTIFLSCVFWLFYPWAVRHKKIGPILQKISTNEGKKERRKEQHVGFLNTNILITICSSSSADPKDFGSPNNLKQKKLQKRDQIKIYVPEN